MAYLHNSHVIHGDLKPANIMLDKGNTVKIGDFGLSKIRLGASVSSSAQAIRKVGIDTEALGYTVAYTAPETLQGNKISLASDIFSFAVMMWQCATSKTPYFDTDAANGIALVLFVIAGGRPNLPLPADVSPEFTQVMVRCWSVDPSLRPSFVKIVDDLKSSLFVVQ